MSEIFTIQLTSKEMKLLQTNLEGYLGSIVCDPRWDYDFETITEIPIESFQIDSDEEEIEVKNIIELLKKIKSYR
jgi:hypothetical protein